jgi:hypothetical protein
LQIQAVLPGFEASLHTAEIALLIACDAPSLNAVDTVIPDPPIMEREAAPMRLAGAAASAMHASAPDGCAAMSGAQQPAQVPWCCICALLCVAGKRSLVRVRSARVPHASRACYVLMASGSA